MAGDGLTTCLWFDTEGEEAARYYLSIFKVRQAGPDQPVASRPCQGAPGAVMTVESSSTRRSSSP